MGDSRKAIAAMEDRQVDDRESQRDFQQAQSLIKQRRVFPRMPIDLKRLVGKIVTDRGIAAQLSSQEVADAWQSLTHARWPNRTRVAGVNRGKLEVIVRDSITNQELTFEKSQLLHQLKQLLPDAKIQSLVFKIGGM